MKENKPAQPAQPDHAGLRCWRCGQQELPVDYTRRKRNAVMRRRACQQCGAKLVTWERAAGEQS